MTYPPLKRHPALVPLSREHFNGLVQVRRLRQAADADAPRRRHALTGFLANWSTEMAAHFDDEERLLGPLMSLEDCQRLLADHAQLRAWAGEVPGRAVATEPESEWMREVATFLEHHIRWEERECYERLQQTRAQELAALMPAARDMERCRTGAAPRGRTLRNGD
jgi:hemerythrin